MSGAMSNTKPPGLQARVIAWAFAWMSTRTISAFMLSGGDAAKANKPVLDRPGYHLRSSVPVAAAARPSAAGSSTLGSGAARALVAGALATLWAQLVRGQRRRSGPSSRSSNCRVAVARSAIPAGGYCETVETCTRRKTRSVNVGGLLIGSEHPIATQTMATTLTHDVEATVAQIKKCADLGIDIVRITVQGMREAKATKFIKERLLEDGYTTPIVADIHFTPKVAMVAADYVDKIRVNPGNFADGRKSFDTISELTKEDVKQAQDEIEEVFAPLVLKLKDKNKALRIGVNHGSLSERILFQYGDSPEGMVASALEFGEICRKYDYHNFVFSMKASNPQVMVRAYRALCREMYKLGWDYPIHLGVTEAGGGADGRVKSATGIGALLLDGIGDTIRVSLTEDPEYEAKPCIALRSVAENAWGKGVAAFDDKRDSREGKFTRRKCEYPLDVPLNPDGSVMTTVRAEELSSMDRKTMCDRFGLRLRQEGNIQKDWKSIDVVVVEGPLTEPAGEITRRAGEIQGSNLKLLLNTPVGVVCRPGPYVPEGATLLYDASDVQEALPSRLGGYALTFTGEEPPDVMEKAVTMASPRFIFLKPKSQEGVTFLARRFFAQVNASEAAKTVPVMLWFQYPGTNGVDEDDIVVRASADMGSLFIDGFGEGMLWESEVMSPEMLRESSFNLLQAARMRISKTEFISCPSCGRTLFNLQETTKRIQERTGHLPGVRIAVMGCIVNGPGEMADADFGYVGSGPGKVDLYVNYDCVKRGIPQEKSLDALVDLIKEHGRWQEPGNGEEEEAALELERVGLVATM